MPREMIDLLAPPATTPRRARVHEAAIEAVLRMGASRVADEGVEADEYRAAA